MPANPSQPLLYTTRGCYRNPGRDRGLVMGQATLTSEPKTLREPVRFRDSDFHVGFSLDIHGVAVPHNGVELASLAGQLDALPDPMTWSVRMRRTFLPLTSRDSSRLTKLLGPKLWPRAEVLADYLKACKVLRRTEEASDE